MDPSHEALESWLEQLESETLARLLREYGYHAAWDVLLVRFDDCLGRWIEGHVRKQGWGMQAARDAREEARTWLIAALEVLKKAPRGCGRSCRVRTLVGTVLYRKLRNYLRRLGRMHKHVDQAVRSEQVADQAETAEDAASAFARQETLQAITETVEHLEPELRALAERVEQGRTRRQIASDLGLSPSTVNRR